MFSVLDEAELATVAQHSHFVRVARKRFVFREGDKPVGGCIVAQGRLILQKSTNGKRPIVGELLGNGDPFGIVSAARGEVYPMSSQALSESVILMVDQDFLESLTEGNLTFAGHLFDLCRARFQAAQRKFSRLAHADSKIRVANALLLFSEKFSSGAEPVLDVTREELSLIAGVTVETCIRVTKQFEEEGILTFPKHKKIRLVRSSLLLELTG